MTKNRLSRRHHFLPRNYLNGFTDESGCFYVYDKLEDRLLPRPLTPNSAFFENNLNTIVLPDGRHSDFMEHLYAEVESKTWASLDNIRRSTADHAVKLRDKLHLFHFLTYLHWRLPSNFSHVDRLSKSLFAADSNLPFAKIVDELGRDAPDQVLSTIRAYPEWSKLARLIAPLAPFLEEGWGDQLRNWRFQYSGDGGNWFLVGDNPIVARGDADKDPVRCLEEFVFPVSGRILVIAPDQNIRSELTPELAIQFGTAILTRSSRFAACQRKDFLEAIVEDYKLHKRFKEEDTVVAKLFAMLGE